MAREISAGGVVVKEMGGQWHIALIEPNKETQAESLSRHKKPKALLALPKGLVDPGEKPQETAVREVHEETGINGIIVTKLADIKYVYVRTWGDGERVFKIVSFYLLRYESGDIDNITPDMRIEVNRALWVPLSEAASRLAYSNEKKVVRQAEEYLKLYGLSSSADAASVPRSRTRP